MTSVNCTTEHRGTLGKEIVADPASHKEFNDISDSCTNHNSMGQQTEVEVCSLLCHQESFCWESCSVSKHLKFSFCKAEIILHHPQPAYYLSIRLKKKKKTTCNSTFQMILNHELAVKHFL